MVLYVFDAAFPPPNAAIRAAGGIAMNVYVSGNYAQTPAYVASLRAAGIGAIPNYEIGLWELVSDRAAGQAAGRRGIADAIRCGFPANGTIWFPFSVDVSVSPSDYPKVAEAFRGIQDVNKGRYRISVYGQGGLAEYLRLRNIIAEKGWLSASSSFPGYDRASGHICMWQELGSPIPSTDRNTVTDVSALGAWWPAGSPHTKEIDVPLTDADVAKIWSYALTRYDPKGKPDSGSHPASSWLTSATDVVQTDLGKQIAALAAAGQGPQVALGKQIAALAAAVANSQPQIDIPALAAVLTPALVAALASNAVLTVADVHAAVSTALDGAKLVVAQPAP